MSLFIDFIVIMQRYSVRHVKVGGASRKIMTLTYRPPTFGHEKSTAALLAKVPSNK